MERIHGCSLKKFTAFMMKENFRGYFWLHRLCIGILSFRFLVLNFLYNLSTSFLAYGSFAKVFQLFKSFQMVFSMTIFGEDFFQPFDAQDLKFAIFNFLQQLKLYAPALWLATCIFFHFLVSNDKNQILPIRVSLILGNSFHLINMILI